MSVEKGAVDVVRSSYDRKLEQLNKSEFVKSVKLVIGDKPEIKILRCLGLGPFSSSSQAMYQLCFLNLLKTCIESQEKDTSVVVSLWDPVFSTSEVEFLESELKFIVKEEESTEDITSTLYYMPHFPIGILEDFITATKPKQMLTNNLTVYTFKFTDEKYFSRYPNCARLTKKITDKKEKLSDSSKSDSNNGFEVVTKKKNRKKKNAYVPPVVDYDFDNAYFEDVEYTDIKEGDNTDQPWNSSFTDLTYMNLKLKDTLP